jgi:hypothetical protein
MAWLIGYVIHANGPHRAERLMNPAYHSLARTVLSAWLDLPVTASPA